ncbi:MAG: transcriptional repressor [Deltaproteobacteria bacterium]|nr:transcriptional repressor [Deltaproteobacteria bacterium]
MHRVIEDLRAHGIAPTPQRIAVAEFVLRTHEHPTADTVWDRVRERMPTVSRATVYNTLNLFVEKGLLRTQVLKEGTVVFDPHVERHHHFIDEKTGEIVDIPWNALRVAGANALDGFDVHEFQVVLRGTRRKR